MLDNLKDVIVIAVLNQKGGVGKTTIATNLTHGLILKGYAALLVDGDPQGSARDWHEANEARLVPCVGLDRETLPIDLKSIVKGYNVVVIDGAPQIAKLSGAAMKAADVVLIPVQPSPYDIWATSELVQMLKMRQEMAGGNPKAAFVISRAIKNTLLSREVEGALSEYEIEVLECKTSQYVGYAHTANKGDSIYSLTNSPAAIEFDALVVEIINKYLKN